MIKSDKIWDLIANNYDKCEMNFEPIHIKTIENTKKYLNRDDIVLDYGCETGTKAFELAGDVKKVRGIDISSKVIEISKRKTIERKTPNVDFAQRTIFDERLEKGSLCDTGFQYSALFRRYKEGYAKDKRIVEAGRVLHFFNRMHGRGEEMLKNLFISCVVSTDKS